MSEFKTKIDWTIYLEIKQTALEETAPGNAEIVLNKIVISNDVAQTEDQVATRMRATGAHEGKSYPLLLTK